MTQRVKKTANSATATREKFTVEHKREITEERRRANSKSTACAHKVSSMSLLRTPYGLLFAPERLADLKAYLMKVSRAAVEFNAGSKTAKLSNCIIWERLGGNRLAAVQGWVEREAREGRVVPPGLFSLAAVEDTKTVT